MLLSPFLWASACTAAVLSTSLLQTTHADDGLTTAPITAPELGPSSNTSGLSSNESSLSGGILKIACDSRYGKNLKVKSCRQLFGYIKKDNTQYRFAERDSGIPHDLNLPMRTYSDDGLCFVQPILVKDAVVGHASISEIGTAAWTMVQACVVERGMGGLALNLGGDIKINVVVAAFKPNVKCEASGTSASPEWLSCVTVFTSMRATKKIQVFGSSDEEAVDEQLPMVLEAADGKCQVVIGINGKDTLASWYEIWESVTAIASMCTKTKHKGGKAEGLGLHKNIFLELSVLRPFPQNQRANWSNVSSTERSVALQYLQSSSAESDYSSSDQSVPFELVPNISEDEDDSSSLTLNGEFPANVSRITSF